MGRAGTIVFVFVPIYVEIFRARGPEQAAVVSSQDLQSQDRQPPTAEPPFWTWFVDNPRPPSPRCS
jgi:hypothetical protein